MNIMIENLHGTFTLAIFISSIAILASLLLFNFVLWPILKIILTPIIGGSIIISGYFDKIFAFISEGFKSKEELKKDENKSTSENFFKKIENKFISVTSLLVILPFLVIIYLLENKLLFNKMFLFDLNVIINVFFSFFGLMIYGVLISYILKMIMKDGYKIYVPFVFLFMSFVIFKDRFLL